jgi:uncharacterized protein (TIGR00369 family)
MLCSRIHIFCFSSSAQFVEITTFRERHHILSRLFVKYPDFEKIYKGMCHFDQHLGLNLTIHEPGRITYTMTVQRQHLSSLDACHGGAIAAMMDATLGLTALSWAIHQGKLCSTVEFKTNFLAPAKPGDQLEGTGEIDFIGAKLVVTNAKILDKNTGQLVAKGMGTFALYPISKKGHIEALLCT